MKELLLGLIILIQGGYQHSPNSNYGDGAIAVVRVEKPAVKDLNVGIEYSYHGQTAHSEYGVMSGHSLLGDLVYYPETRWPIKPYIVGGLGWSWWDFERSQDMKDRGIQIKMGDSFAKKVGAGFDYPIGKNWSVNVEWNYFQSHVPKESFYESTGAFANVVTDEKTIGQEETNLMVGLKYRF